MIRLCHLFALGLSACCLHLTAADQPVEAEAELVEPLADIAIPDIERLRERYSKSIYGILWNDPNNAFIRDAFTQNMTLQFDRIKQRDGLDLQLILSNLERAGATLISLDSSAPDMSMYQAYISFKENGAKEIMKLSALDGAAALVDADGADEAFISENGSVVLSRFGNTLVISDPDYIEVPAQPAGIESDIQINVAGKKLIHTIIDTIYAQAPQKPKIKKEHLKQVIGRYDQFTHTATIKEAGIYEEIDFIGPEKSGVQPLDKKTLSRIPQNALAVAALGVNGKDLWTDHILSIIDLIAEEDGSKSTETIITEINNNLSFLGIDQNLSDIFEGLSGTYFMTITPSVPYPAISIGIPRSESTDTLINSILVAQLNIIRPPEGQIEMIPMPTGIPPLQLGFGKDYWFLSTDPVLTKAWISGNSSGWDKTPVATSVLGDLKEEPFLVAAMDAKQVITIGQSTLGLLSFAARGEEKTRIQTVQKLLQRAAQLVEPNYIVATQNKSDFHYEMYSLCGSLPVLMAPGAIVGGLRQQQRRRAWRDAQRKQRDEMRKQEAEKPPTSVDEL